MANTTTSTKTLVASIFNALLAAVTTVSTAITTGGNVKESAIAGGAALAVGVGASVLTYFVPNVAKAAQYEATAENVLGVIAQGASAAQTDLATLYGPEYRAKAAAALAAADTSTSAPAEPAQTNAAAPSESTAVVLPGSHS